MGKTLVIVESPTKAKAIGKFLSSSYVVKPSMGHVRDLPKSELGIDVENNFEPKYITIRGKGSIIKSLKDEAKKCDNVLLAADPDREGEVIAWHLRTYLPNIKDKCRVEFNEITKDTVKKAVKVPREIDMNRVNAQQARRVLDRLVGYKISPLLWAKVKKGLSAGRVQSVAVRLICDRDEEIKNFVPVEYWSLNADLETGNGILSGKLQKINGKKADIHNEDEMQSIIKDLNGAEYVVKNVSKKQKMKNPVAPFTTSSLQQEAYRKHNMVTKKTMQVAQQLYEGIELGKEGTVGLITYMRTDSVRVSPEAQTAAREYIVNKYGEAYIPASPRVFKSKGKIQDAHEAIRPSNVQRLPKDVKQYLTPQQYKLYKLVWERFVASQMSSAVLDVTGVDIEAKNYQFRATGSVLKFAGYMQLYMEGRDEDEEKEDLGMLPEVQNGQVLALQKLDPKQHFTQPPARYTEAMLVKALEEKGIGRPSTYAPIIDTILGRGYVVREEKHFYSTELGQVVVDILTKSFGDIMDVDFTAHMEQSLDNIEEGNAEWRDIIAAFYGPFSEDLAKAEANLEKIEIAPEMSDEVCEKCGKPMVYRLGKYGKFLACSGFPECRNTKAIVVETGVKCKACGGNIIQKKSRGGRIFYGCSNYPECKYVAWDAPIDEVCPECGTQLTQKKLRNGTEKKICPNKDCPTNANTEKAKRGRKPKPKVQ
ncbi:MAG: type I DNA topoisomerase [Bacillota bacterium]|jgi:DNA topoisomerase-1